MNRKLYKKELLKDITDQKSMNIVNGCIGSLKISIDIAKMPTNQKQHLLDLLNVMEKHYNKIQKYIDESVNH